MIWLLVGYMWLFIHRPFEVWPWLGAFHIERVYMIVAIAYWALCTPKVWTSNCINWGVGALATAIVLAACFSPYTGLHSITVQNWLKIWVFYILMMSSISNERDLRIIVIAFVVITALYELHSFREYLCGRGVYRMGVRRMVGVDSGLGDPNAFAASANYGITMLMPLWTLTHKRWQCLAIIGLFFLACLCVFLTGSRTGFAGLSLLLLGGGLATRYRWRLLLLLLVAAPLVWASLSQDLQNRYLTLIDPSRGPANAQQSADSREQFFWMAVEIWKQHPIFGVGPGCFSLASGTGMQAHTLYGQTISELGAVGVIALIGLIGCYLANYLEARRIYRDVLITRDVTFCYYVILATAITLAQLLFFGFGGHNLFRFTWLWCGAFGALALKLLRDQCYCEARVDPEAVELTELSRLDTSQPFPACN